MKNDGLSRRRFIALASVGAAGAVIGVPSAETLAGMMGGGGGGCGGGGGGTTIIDPPPGMAFIDPAEARNLSSLTGVVEVAIEAREATVNVNGVMATLQTYNGSYPGPTIRAKKGDTLKIHMKNSLPYTTEKNILGHTKNITNLHTHGLHVSPNPPADYMGVLLSSGQGYDYSYDLKVEEAGHLTMYHPHVHGVVAEQYWAGLMGALIVEDGIAGLGGYETHTMVLKDITLSGSVPAPYTSTMEYMMGKEGNTIMVNGQVNPKLNIRPGQVQRWRIYNACTARFFKLSLENHDLYIVGTDGGLLDRPYRISSMLLSPGERIDVLVKAGRSSGSYKFLSLPYDRGGGCSLQQVTLLTLSYKGSPVNDAMPSIIDGAAARISMDTSALPYNRLELSMMRGAGYINGQTFIDMDHVCKVTSRMGTYEVWEVVNKSGMDHPFHQHVNCAQVLSVTGGDPGYAAFLTTAPAMKDTVIIPKLGSVKLLMPVMDYDGMTMFHCHILEHEDIGMLGVWDIMCGMPM